MILESLIGLVGCCFDYFVFFASGPRVFLAETWISGGLQGKVAAVQRLRLLSFLV